MRWFSSCAGSRITNFARTYRRLSVANCAVKIKTLLHIYACTLSSCSVGSRVVLSRYRLHSNSSDKARSSHNVHLHRHRSTFDTIFWTMTSLDAIIMSTCFIYRSIAIFPIVSRELGVRVWRQWNSLRSRQLHKFESHNAFSGEIVSYTHSWASRCIRNRTR